MATRELLVRINGDTKGLEKALGVSEKKGSKFSKVLGGIGKAAKVAAVGVGVATGVAVVWGKKATEAYNKQIEAQTKLRTNLLNVKGATEQHVQALFDQASALQAVGIVGDETIIAGQSQLATFNLQASSIKKLTPKIADMVTQLKGHNATTEDFININNLVGKVMTGNVGSLSRYGVTLDETQMKVLKNGTEAEKAATLVDVLSQNYGNVNEALRNTPQGQLTALKNTWGDFQELIGEFVSNLVTPLVGGMNDWFASMGGPEGVLDSIKLKLKEFYDIAWPVVTAIRDYLEPKFFALGNTIKDLMPTMERLFNEVIKPLADVIGRVLVFSIGLAIDALNLLLTILKPVTNWMLDNKGVVLGFAGAFGTLKASLMMRDAFRALQTGFNTLTSTTIPNMKNGLSNFIKFATGGGGFAIVAAAGVGAAIAIEDAWRRAQDQLDKTNQSIDALKSSNEKAKEKIRRAMKEGKISIEDANRAINSLDRDVQSTTKTSAWREFTKIWGSGDLTQVLPKVFGREAGGPVEANQPYVVGEKRPELFVPDRPGTILPEVPPAYTKRDASIAKPIQSSPTTINFAPTIQVGMFAGMPTEYREIAERLWVEFMNIGRSNGIKLDNIGVRPQ